MPRPGTRAQTYDALGRTPGSRLARTKRCRDPRPGLERTTRSAVTAPRGPPSSHRRVTHEGSGPPDPARRHPGRLGLGRPAVPRCGAPQPGGGVGPWRHGKVVRRHGPEGQPVPESDSRPAVAMISRRRPNRARRACAANRYRRVPGLGEESDRPEGIGRAPCTDWACLECGTAGRTRARCGAHSDQTRAAGRGRARGPGANDRAARHWGPPCRGLSTKFDQRASHGAGGM